VRARGCAGTLAHAAGVPQPPGAPLGGGRQGVRTVQTTAALELAKAAEAPAPQKTKAPRMKKFSIYRWVRSAESACVARSAPDD